METPQTFQCEKCGNAHNLSVVKKLLGKFYCPDCISALRLERKLKLREEKEAEEQKMWKKLDLARKKEAEEQKLIQDLKESGPTPLEIPDLPLNLKRNERIYFLAGDDWIGSLKVGVVLTNLRFFYGLPPRGYVRTYNYDVVHVGGKSSFMLESRSFMLESGIKPVKLSSVIAIYPNGTVHFDNGKNIRFFPSSSEYVKLFKLTLTELVDRINDPIDESVFSPTRERMSDDLKMSVWRRDGGRCARCGSRDKLEYDHIIPVSKGGSNTLRNIELLCEACNRAKSNRIM